MQSFEYKVVPAPARAEKVKGLKRSDERYAHTIGKLMNDMAAEGWDYLRAEALPCEERKGMMGGTTTTFVNLLVFRRPGTGAQAATGTEKAAEGVADRPAPVVTAPVAAAPAVTAQTETPPVAEPTEQAAPDETPPPAPEAEEQVEMPAEAPAPEPSTNEETIARRATASLTARAPEGPAPKLSALRSWIAPDPNTAAPSVDGATGAKTDQADDKRGTD